MPERGRVLYNAVTRNYQWRYTSHPGSGLNTTVNQSDVHWTMHHRIGDVTGSRATVKPVYHTKITWRPNEVPTVISGIGGIAWYSEAWPPNLQYNVPESWANQPSGINGPSVPSDGLRAELADKAFDAFFTQVPQEVDVANFLIDFKDIKDLIPEVQDTIAKTISGGFLNYSFGWAPLIGDVKKLAGILESTRKRLAWLRSTFGKRTPLGYTQEFDVISASPSIAGHPWELTLTQSSGVFTTGCYLTHRLQRLDGLEGELRGLVAALGLNSPGKIVWERIPFSFIVDWVSRVGTWAGRQGEFQPFIGEWNVSDVSHSFKQRVEYEVRYNAPTTTVDNVVIGSIVYETYHRNRGLPLSSALFYGRELTPQQLALSAALIGAAS